MSGAWVPVVSVDVKIDPSAETVVAECPGCHIEFHSDSAAKWELDSASWVESIEAMALEKKEHGFCKEDIR